MIFLWYNIKASISRQWGNFFKSFLFQCKIGDKSTFFRLGGAMIWALDLDDFRNVCDCEEYPLLKTINRALRNYPQRKDQCPLEPVRQGNTLSFLLKTSRTDWNPLHIVQKPVYADEPQTITEKPTRKPTTTASSISESAETTSLKPATSKKPTKKKKKTTTKAPSTTSKEPDYELINHDEQTVDHSNDPALPQDCGTLFVPHESDCRKYYMCNYGRLFEQT